MVKREEDYNCVLRNYERRNREKEEVVTRRSSSCTRSLENDVQKKKSGTDRKSLKKSGRSWQQ